MIEIVAAVGKKGVIGYQGNLPWPRLKADMRHFQQLTTGHTVVMGRKTWESLPQDKRPLKGRTNVVISHQPVEGADHTVDESWLLGAAASAKTIFVIGGAQIYQLALPLVGKLHLTEIYQEFDGDTFFPGFPLAESDWIQQVAETEPTGDSDLPYCFTTYVRRERT